MDWFLFVSVIFATPLFVVDHHQTMEAGENVEATTSIRENPRIRLSERKPITFKDVGHLHYKIQLDRDKRTSTPTQQHRESLREVLTELEVITSVPRRPRNAKKGTGRSSVWGKDADVEWGPGTINWRPPKTPKRSLVKSNDVEDLATHLQSKRAARMEEP